VSVAIAKLYERIERTVSYYNGIDRTFMLLAAGAIFKLAPQLFYIHKTPSF
jgi:hypothetical protein